MLNSLFLSLTFCLLGCADVLARTNAPPASPSLGKATVIAPITLPDQFGSLRTCDFNQPRLTVLTVADRKGCEQIASWVAPVKERYGARVDIEGLADVSAVPGPLQGMVRKKLRAQVQYPIMLDWSGEIIQRFTLSNNVANLFLVGARGRLLLALHGAPDYPQLDKLFAAIDAGLSGTNRAQLNTSKDLPSPQAAR